MIKVLKFGPAIDFPWKKPSKKERNYFPSWEVDFPLMGNLIPLWAENLIHLILASKVKALDFIKESFIADLQNFGGPLSIPACFFKNFAD